MTTLIRIKPDEARRIAANIAKLPGAIAEIKHVAKPHWPLTGRDFREVQKIRTIPRIGKIFQNGETAMRMMLKFTLPVEKSNAAINDGSLGRTMESILSTLKPEAAYFAPLEGKRAGMIFFDMADPSQIVEIVEPFFLSLNASTELVPVMNADDLRKGLAKVAGK